MSKMFEIKVVDFNEIFILPMYNTYNVLDEMFLRKTINFGLNIMQSINVKYR
jgi:hypothetical protein